jgi:hypothetical protein
MIYSQISIEHSIRSERRRKREKVHSRNINSDVFENRVLRCKKARIIRIHLRQPKLDHIVASKRDIDAGQSEGKLIVVKIIVVEVESERNAAALRTK